MFTLGLLLDNVYANVDALDDAKKRRVQQAVNAALHDIASRHPWPGYRTRLTLETLTDGVLYLPSDLAWHLNFQVRDTDDSFLGRAKFVDRDQMREDRYQKLYRLLSVGIAPESIGGYRSTVQMDFADGATSIPGGIGGDFNLNIDTHAGWIQAEGESTPRRVTNNATPVLARQYYGPNRKDQWVFLNPNRQQVVLFIPSSLDATDTSAGLKVDIDYCRLPEDATHPGMPIYLPNLECVEAAATARIMRQDRRREDADRWSSDAESALVTAMAAAMDYQLEHAYGPEDAAGETLTFGKGDVNADTITQSPLS